MKKTRLIALLPAALALVACGGNAPSESVEEFPELNYTVTYKAKDATHGTITDMIGRKVDIAPGSYRAVVCIGAGALRLYSYVGDMNLICGVEDIDNLDVASRPKMFDNVARPYFLANQEKLRGLPSCGVGGPNAQTAEAEKIAVCEPDIVISEYEDVNKADALQQTLGVPVVTLNYGSGGMVNNGLYGTLAMLGKVFDRETRAKEIIDFHYGSNKAIFDRTKNVKSRKKAYICGLGNWGTTNQFMTAENFDSFNIAHIDNVVHGLPNKGIGPITEEMFISLSGEMDSMFFDAAAVKNIKGKGFDFSACKAFQNGQVYLQMAYNAYYTNVETALINNWFIAKCAYPDLFEDVQISVKADEVYSMFNCTNLYDRVLELSQSYGGYQKISNPTEFFA